MPIVEPAVGPARSSTMQSDATSIRIETFWLWFAGFAAELRADAAVEAVDARLDELLGRLRRIDTGLFVEVLVDGDRCELVVTAGGDRERFGLVDAVVAAAPELPPWRFVALKPARGFAFEVQRDGIELHADRLAFVPLVSSARPDLLGLRIGIAGLGRERLDDVRDVVVGVLETGLGERVLAEEVAHVEIAPMPDDPGAHGYAWIDELPRFLADRRARDRDA